MHIEQYKAEIMCRRVRDEGSVHSWKRSFVSSKVQSLDRLGLPTAVKACAMDQNQCSVVFRPIWRTGIFIIENRSITIDRSSRHVGGLGLEGIRRA